MVMLTRWAYELKNMQASVNHMGEILVPYEFHSVSMINTGDFCNFAKFLQSFFVIRDFVRHFSFRRHE